MKCKSIIHRKGRSWMKVTVSKKLEERRKMKRGNVLQGRFKAEFQLPSLLTKWKHNSYRIKLCWTPRGKNEWTGNMTEKIWAADPSLSRISQGHNWSRTTTLAAENGIESHEIRKYYKASSPWIYNVIWCQLGSCTILNYWHAKIVDPPHLRMKLKPMGQLYCLATWKDNADEKWKCP